MRFDVFSNRDQHKLSLMSTNKRSQLSAATSYASIPTNDKRPTMTTSRSIHDIANEAEEKLDVGQKKRCKWIIWGGLIGIFILSLFGTTGYLVWHFVRSSNLDTFEVIGNIGVNVNTRSGVIYAKGENEIHAIRLGQISQGSLVFSKTCTLGTTSSERINKALPYLCLMYGVDKAKIPEYRLLIQNTQSDADGFECYEIRWDFPAKNTVKDCLHISNLTRFYGGGIRTYQTWPTDLQPLTSQPVAPDYSNENGFRSVAVPYWIFTSGVSIMLDTRFNSVVNWNDSSQTKSGEFCFGTPTKEGNPNDRSSQIFSYSVCLGNDIAQTHRKSALRFTGSPANIPLDESIISKPIWNTLAYGIDEFHNIDQEAIQTLATQLLENDLPASQILIDPRWEQHPGDDTFNVEHFLEPSSLFSWLRNGPGKIKPVLMLHPFISSDSSAFSSLISDEVYRKYFVKDELGGISNVTWWMGNSAMLDFTDYNAVRYKEARLKGLLEAYQMLGCRYLGGSSGWPYLFPDIMKSRYWRDFHAAFETGARRICGENVQLETSSQFGKTVLNMPDVTPNTMLSIDQHLKRQLESLIPNALTLGLFGHTVFISSPVGGNPFLDKNGRLDFQNAESRFPSPSTFLRWLGVVLFMPVIEFSIPPWFYSDDPRVLQATKKLLVLRTKNLNYILNTARKAWTSNEAMVLPLWSKFPRDPATWNCSDQFLVGSNLMVAPIVTPDLNTRKLYLPKGEWTDAQGAKITGPKWIDVFVEIDDVPHFFTD